MSLEAWGQTGTRRIRRAGFLVLLLLPCATSRLPAAKRPMEAVHAEAKRLLEKPGAETQALQVLDAGLADYPKAEPLHRLAGIAAFRLRRVSRARSELEQAIALSPKQPFSYLKLASLLLCEEKKGDEADRVLTRMREALPGDVASLEEAAAMCAQCGDADRAIALWLALARSQPRNAWMYRFKAGQLYHSGGRWSEARTLLERALAEGPSNSPELPAQLGATLARLGLGRQAAERYRQALARKPDDALRRKLEQELLGLATAPQSR